MCGRVFIRSDFETLLRNFGFARQDEILRMGNQFPRLNGAPSLDYPIIIKDEDRSGKVGPVFISAKWGLVPSWMKPPLNPQINARADTIKTKPMFRSAYRSRRCLVPVDGYFEWQALDPKGKKKQPYAISLKSDKPFAMAGIWETWRDPETDLTIRTFAIVTTEANEMMSRIHDRMPVILKPEDYDRWLSDEPDPADLLAQYPSDEMKMWPVTRDMGKASYQAADVLNEIDPDPEPDLF
ncbi:MULTISPECIES: SOS response-associated peptidase [unclassified Rhizobium]|uniref:SOS response-associated peptidase n=1 Tax=unclassified Rhizobium TaxID=2613769 RepID=UPI0016154438|nr:MULTISPECIES: SOS response-associated peptidase [unclassified Rhizobium]MBB3385975.1 putative SOS response-associated peptidase YedK [Rhizobium sp. BK098]MBB3617847.1 putative SOS response-associated peptidase YedK [Rhizobium sp. BK609]MBB3683337.1 putative SOS response-associated peptidase YedK [Rhizobium sp. BK612]